MPLREDLLEPIAGDNPSGVNLYYDKVFDQIKEARTEEEVVGSQGAWDRAAKKADHVLVIKLAGEALAKRTKDLRLAGWLIESHLKKEGLTLLPVGLDLIWKIEEKFWDTFYPEIDEDGDLGLRVSAVEGPVVRFANILKTLPITKAGFNCHQYTDSRRLGYEEAVSGDYDKQAARQDAIDHGALTPEEFDLSVNSTPKATFVATEAALARSLEILDEMGVFHEEKYGDDYPALNKLVTAVSEVKQIVSALLYEKRKTDPDVVVEPDPVEEEVVEEEPTYEAAPVEAEAAAPVAKKAPPKGSFSGTPTTTDQAYAAALAGALFLFTENPQSPAPYLICAGIRFGETRAQGGSYAYDFAVAPPTETRQAMRRLANESMWAELLELGLRTLAEPCARGWLDLQRYLWRAATSVGSYAIATAVVSTVRGLLVDHPEVRGWMMDDDTPAANAETQQWIDAEVLPPAPEVAEVPAAPEPEPYYTYTPPPSESSNSVEEKAPDIYEQASALLQRGQASDAIRMLVRDAELQPSGRTKFLRRVQVAQLCLTANQGAIAYPVLMELSKEIERRGLETWETGEMLAQPLGLLLKCMEQRQSSPEEREIVFERLCRLDPEAAMGIN